MRVRVPRDQPTLARALESGADRIVLQGVVDLPEGPAGAILSRPVHISGGTLRAHGGWALIVGEGVRLSDLIVENPTGHGVRIVAGAPVLENVELRVKGVAGVCEGHSKPILRRVMVDGADNGWLLREDTAPDADELAVKATGSAIVATDRAGGHLARLALVSGDSFACIEAHGESTTTLAGLTVLSAGCGALHLYASSRITVEGGHIQRSGTADARFPAIEVREQAAPTLTDLKVEQSGGRGVFLHGSCQPVLRNLSVDAAASQGVEAQGDVMLDVSGLSVVGAAGGGVVLRGAVTGRLQAVHVDDTRNVGVGLGEDVRVEVDGLRVRQAEGAGLRVAGRARAVVRQAMLELLGCPGVRVHEEGHLTLHAPIVRANRADGVQVDGAASLVVRHGQIGENEGKGLSATGSARVRANGVAITGNQGWNVAAADSAEVRWSGSPVPERVSVAPGAKLVDRSAVAADGVGQLD